MRSIEAKTFLVQTKQTLVEFIHEDVFTRFVMPFEIVTDGGTHFTSRLVEGLMNTYKIMHR